MTKREIIPEILKELKRSKKQFQWPTHIVSRAAIVSEEAGELMKACLELKYEPDKNNKNYSEMRHNIQIEAIQTAAMAIRFLENFK